MMSEGFLHIGIQPFHNNIKFSLFPTFYVVNDIAMAFEFLHNHFAKDPEDTIVVFCFGLILEILHGDLPSPRRETFGVRWFEQDINDEM